MTSTPAVWKQYNRMAVVHVFKFNSTYLFFLAETHSNYRKCPMYSERRGQIVTVVTSVRIYHTLECYHEQRRGRGVR